MISTIQITTSNDKAVPSEYCVASAPTTRGPKPPTPRPKFEEDVLPGVLRPKVG